MNNKIQYSTKLLDSLAAGGVDVAGVLEFLDNLNDNKFLIPDDVDSYTIPDLSHPGVFDRRMPAVMEVASRTLNDFSQKFAIPETVWQAAPVGENGLVLDEPILREIGIHLYAFTGFGVLNGGAATTYGDKKKNEAYCKPFFDSNHDLFTKLAKQCVGVPKGITPAYINPDGSPGFSFMELKFRMLMLERQRYQKQTGKKGDGALPFFQMTSPATDTQLADAYKRYAAEPFLAGSCGFSTVLTGVQPLYAAMQKKDGVYQLFDCAWNKPDTGIPVPGGHGQNYRVLADIYRSLRDSGIRYVWVGNVDNLAYTVDPVSLAVFALSGADAAFETSVKTAIDKKGGVLVETSSGKLTCVDIGAGISPEQVSHYEADNKTLLFNCGIGLYDLDVLVAMLDDLPYKLPLRLTVQDKDAGVYVQGEQNMWEIMGVLNRPLFFAVNKQTRFIAAKMLSETLLNSCTSVQINKMVEVGVPLWLCDDARQIHVGLVRLLHDAYGLWYSSGSWDVPPASVVAR